MIFPDKLWLWLAKKCPDLKHPFNQVKGGVQNLNYSPWEFKHAGDKTYGFTRFTVAGMGGDFSDYIKGKKVVDLACGAGGKSVWMASVGAKKVDGVDLSAGFIDQAKEFAKEKKTTKICDFYVGDAQKTDLKGKDYDVCVASSIFEHVADPEALLREACRLVKKGGYVCLNTEGYWHWLGHHLWDALPIPWMHCLTSEAQRVRLYKKACKAFPDGEKRVKYRISKNDKGKDHISYLNHITLRKMRKILKKLEQEGLLRVSMFEVDKFRRQPLRFFGKLPILDELFHRQVLFVLEVRV